MTEAVPYVGLRPFDTADARWFFGREREVASLTRQMRASRFTAVVGPSGSGKSSIVRAGVVPKLAGDGWLPIIAKPGSAPLARLAGALVAAAGEDPLAEAHRFRIQAELRGSAFGLARVAETLRPDKPRLLLVIDQFEELFRYGDEATGLAHAAMREEARAFVELLLAATRGETGRLDVCVTMRSDFFGACSAYIGLAEAVSLSQFLVPLPRRDQLDDAIRKPVALAGAVIEEALVQRLLVDVEDQPDKLPLLQHTLRRLWEQATGEPRTVREDEYVAVGRIAGSIDVKAEAVAELLKKANPADAATLERVMKALTDLDQRNHATRRPQKRSELLALFPDGAAASLDRVLAALAAEDTSFLQTGDGDDPELDIGHEALIRSWARLSGPARDFTRGWLREEREDGDRWREYVRRAAENTVLSPGGLRRLSNWIERGGATEGWSQRYGDRWAEVLALKQRSERRGNRILLGVGGVLAMLVVAAVLFWRVEEHRRMIAAEAAAHAREQAAEAAGEALRSARLGSLALAFEARRVVDSGDARMAALLARAALPANPDSGDPRYVVDAESALDDALARPIERLRLVGHQAPVASAAYSPDGKRIVSASYDSTLRIWDAATGRQIGEPLRGHAGWVNSAAFSPDGTRIVSGSDDKTVRLWDAATGKPIGQPMTGHTDRVTSVAFSPDGKRIVSGSVDMTLRLWDAATGQPIGQPLTGHTSWVNGVAFSPDGKRIASASGDATVRLWDAATGKPIGEPLRGPNDWVYSVAFSPDGTRIASASGDGTLRLWDAATGQPVGQPLVGHTGTVLGVAFSPDGRRIVSASPDRTLRLWDAATGLQVGPPLPGHTDWVRDVMFSPDGQHIVSAGGDQTLRIWDLGAGEPIGRPMQGHTDSLVAAFSPDGRRIVDGGADGMLRLWDAATGRQIGAPLAGHTDTIRSVAFSPDGKRIVSASNDKTLRLWDAATGKPIGQPMTGHTAQVTSAAFSPDGARIVSGSVDTTLRLWDAATGKPIGEPLKGHTDWVNGVAFSPDGSRIASASGDNTVRLWDAATGKPIGEPLRGHTYWVYSAVFSPDGERIVSASADQTLRLWDARTGQPVGLPFQGHTGQVLSAAFSPDGRRIVSTSDDRTLRVWDARTGQPLGPPLQGHSDWVGSGAFSPDGRRILSAASDGTLSMWTAPELPDLAAAMAKADTLCPPDDAERAAHGLVDRVYPEPPKPWTDDEKRACGMVP